MQAHLRTLREGQNPGDAKQKAKEMAKRRKGIMTQAREIVEMKLAADSRSMSNMHQQISMLYSSLHAKQCQLEHIILKQNKRSSSDDVLSTQSLFTETEGSKQSVISELKDYTACEFDLSKEVSEAEQEQVSYLNLSLL